MGHKRKHRPVKQPTRESLLVMKDYFKGVLKCCALTYKEYAALPDYAQAAMQKAADELEAESIILLASALQSERGTLAVGAELDGGDALVRHTLRGAVASVLSKRGATK